jgi:O-methyltransferase involved in polyketide biosynthesis
LQEPIITKTIVYTSFLTMFAHGYDKDKMAFGSLLGISYYLKKVDFEQLIMIISEIMSEGSAICFDYPSVDESAETRKTQMLAYEAGEQMNASAGVGYVYAIKR